MEPPSFAVAGQHLVTLMRFKTGCVRVLPHRGAKAVDAKTGTRFLDSADPRLTWATDQRAQIGSATRAEIAASADWLAGVLRNWVRVAHD